MSGYLTTDEMASLRRALDKRTAGSVSVGTSRITVAQGIALWNATASFETISRPSVAELLRLPRRRARRELTVRDAAGLHQVLKAGMGVAAVASLAGCTTMFGGNVKGSFSCRAPDGICAPTSKIDDAALALISGDTSMSPAGPFMSPPVGAPRTSVTSAEPVRSGEKILRIVFPAHIDGSGRYREATAIHAVVERGEWMAAANTVRPPSPMSMRQAAPSSALSSAELPSVMPTLGELAAAAPELQFPSAVADIDAQNALSDQGSAAPAIAAPAAGKSSVHLKQVGQASSKPSSPLSAGVTPVARSSAAAFSTAVTAVAAQPAVRVAGPDPVAAIRAQVAARLAASTPRSGVAPVALLPAAQTPRNSVSAVRYTPPTATGAQPFSLASGAQQRLAAPVTGVKPSADTSTTVRSAPVYGPTLFPVSDVHP
jgi:conjugal transfer pilus assembly protein TraV